MIVFLDTSHKFEIAEQELGCAVGQLFTPLTGFVPQRPDGPFAIDNGSFAKFDTKRFESILRRRHHIKQNCKFLAVPDVVGSARRTLEVFDYWAPKLSAWPLALVAQDGQEDLPIPWSRIEAVFIGGSTQWKLGRHAEAVVKAAKAMGKWVHAGRVNTPGRFEYFEEMGADSIDGTGLSRYSWMRKAIYEHESQQRLFEKAVGE